jgi:hypothetical protein
MVGCDCRLFRVDNQPVEYGGYRSNIFKDKQIRYYMREKKYVPKVQNANTRKPTCNHLRSFMKKFEQVYDFYKDDIDIYMLGPWSISTTIPLGGVLV